MPTWRAKTSRAAPRLLALTWAGYGATRVVAYIDTSPVQLASVSAWMPLWIPWAIATTLLLLGGLTPRRSGPRARKLGMGLRHWGMTITLSLMATWGAAFLITDISRGWVTSLNYLMLMLFAGWSGWFASRDVADVRAVVREEGVNAGMGG